MWLMLQQDAGDDYVVCSGVSRTVRELVDAAFAVVDLDPAPHVVVNPEFVRPSDPVSLVGDPSKARFEDLIRLMVEQDLQDLSQGARVRSDIAH